MNTWNFNELKDLCRRKGISDDLIFRISEYANSLNWRYHRAKFHAEKSRAILKRLFAKSFTFGDQRYKRAAFSYEAHVEACILSLHAMADILSQIINIVLLQNRFHEHTVYLKKIKSNMEKNRITPEIVVKLKELVNCNEFRYIESFSNTIKHRRLIKTHFRAEFGGNSRNEEGLVFREFSYKDVSYPETWGSDIIDKYLKKIFELVNDAGLEINDFLAMQGASYAPIQFYFRPWPGATRKL
jgi:hypothetical protein